jgi:hypothetical protein
MGTVSTAPVAPEEERIQDLPERVREALGSRARRKKGCWR